MDSNRNIDSFSSTYYQIIQKDFLGLLIIPKTKCNYILQLDIVIRQI